MDAVAADKFNSRDYGIDNETEVKWNITENLAA